MKTEVTGPESSSKPMYARIYDLVKQIPESRVATYGQIARLAGGCTARLVGYAMAALKDGRDPDVPWQRVINAQGRISMHGIGSAQQRFLLENEGIVFRPDDSIDLEAFGWEF